MLWALTGVAIAGYGRDVAGEADFSAAVEAAEFQTPTAQSAQIGGEVTGLVGTWVYEGDVMGLKIKSTVTINADGTLVETSTSFFEGVEPTVQTENRIWMVNEEATAGLKELSGDAAANSMVISTGYMRDGKPYFDKSNAYRVWAYTFDAATGVLKGGGGEYAKVE
jgi:hypothetical protein